MNAWNREERTKPRTIAGLARFFRECDVPISDRYIRAAMKAGGYTPEFGNLTTANHFLHWKAGTNFKCNFTKSRATKRPSRHPARRAALAGKSGE